MSTFRLGIDVGGTFTDFLVVSDDGRRFIHKTSSTPPDPSVGVLNGVREIAETLGLEPRAFLGAVEMIVHGTTVATNALLTHNGARVGVIGTEGFRDVLEFRDGTREDIYDNQLTAPEPLAPRHLRTGVAGRFDSAGQELEPLSEDDVRAAVELFRREEVEAVAVCLLHSPANDGHERRVKELLDELLPDLYRTVSTDLLPQVRYYDRMSTTVLNSYVGPIVSRYLDALRAALEQGGFGGMLLIMQSNGGVAAPDEVGREAARALLSGPASAPNSGLAAVASQDSTDCLTIDMGGTSFDAAVVKGGAPLVMTDGVLDRWRLALPMIDIHTIGTGGGSIARVEGGGLLQVGPQSAGASPGPACYGRGGDRPTVTDADLVLGYIDEDFLGGRMRLDRAAAERAIERDVAGPLGLDVAHAASGIFNLVNVNMAAGVREVTVRRGLDARDFPLVVGGGAGPVHATAIAAELEVPTLVVPSEPSVLCAVGMLYSDFKHDYVQSVKSRLDALAPATLQEAWAAMNVRGRETLRRESVGEAATSIVPSLDMRYVGQWWEVNVPLPADVVERADLDEIAEAFHRTHDRLYGYRSSEMPIEVLAVRLTVVGETPKPGPGQARQGSGDSGDAYLKDRPIWSPKAVGFVDAPVFDGPRLATDVVISGPAIVELGTSTIVLLDEYDLTIDQAGSYVVRLRDSAVAPPLSAGVRAAS